LQDKVVQLSHDEVKDKVQIIFCSAQRHWIVASTVGCKIDEVKVYDLLYRTTDEETKKIILSLFQVKGTVAIKFIRCQQQKGLKDCEAFSMAFSTAIAFKAYTCKLRFDQESMRSHLVKCLDQKQMSPFP